MGDIFDALFGQVKYTHKKNAEAISLLNQISQDIEIIYLEGNHDFNLQNLFPNIKLFKISQQPIATTFENKNILLSHGDFNAGFSYKIYSTIIRNPLTLHLLAFIDNRFSHFILNKLDTILSKKNDCKTMQTFEEFTQQRLTQNYNCDYFIDGHFHQNQTFQMSSFTYINIGAFACNQRYFIVKSTQNKELLEEHIFSKGI